MTANSLKIKVQFGGGAELLVGGLKDHSLSLPQDDKSWNIQRLLHWIKDNLLKERVELFLQDDTVRPGILVLVNDADWELMGGHDYELNEGDVVLFISTLHGG